MGLPWTGSIGFGISAVSSPMRVPLPAANTTARWMDRSAKECAPRRLGEKQLSLRVKVGVLGIEPVFEFGPYPIPLRDSAENNCAAAETGARQSGPRSACFERNPDQLV